MMDISDAEALRARVLANALKPLLAGHGGGIQGAALVELVALHLAGHPPQVREQMLALHVETVRELVPVVEREIFGPSGHPATETHA
jgi:hypothetical protein